MQIQVFQENHGRQPWQEPQPQAHVIQDIIQAVVHKEIALNPMELHLGDLLSTPVLVSIVCLLLENKTKQNQPNKIKPDSNEFT
jgi:hypothetical protein